MSAQSIEAYEQYALEFLQLRDNSRVGVRTTDRWARSLQFNSHVLEIGCGGGIPVTETLVDAGLNLWAIDSSPTLVKTFRDRYPDIPVQCVSVLESDFFQRKYDAVISIGLIFLLNEQGQLKMLQSSFRNTSSGWQFLIYRAGRDRRMGRCGHGAKMFYSWQGCIFSSIKKLRIRGGQVLL